MHYFDRRYILYGDISNSKTKIKDVRCEFLVNELATDKMKATVSAIEASIKEIQELCDSDEPIQFVSSEGGQRVLLEGKWSSFHLEGDNDEIMSFKVDRGRFIERYSDNPASTVRLTYYIPAVTLFKRRVMALDHYKKGFLVGWDGWRKENEKEKKPSEWTTDEFCVPSDKGRMSFSPSFLFKDATIDDIETKLILEQPIIECVIDDDPSTTIDALPVFTDMVNDYLVILSFLEGDFINWTKCSATEIGANKNSIARLEMFQRSPKRKNKPAKHDHRRDKYRDQLQQMLVKLTRSFRMLSENEKKTVQKLITRYLVASTISLVDTRLIYWHSCLDVLIKHVRGKGKTFSHRLVDACKKLDVDWLDMYPDMTEESLKEKKEFAINRIRNDMLHHGVYPDDYSQGLEELKRAAALSERFIVRILGHDYTGTGLGTLEFREPV